MANVASKIIKKFENNTSLQRLSSKSNLDRNNYWTPTGSPELDYNLSILGWPKGLITLSGKSKSGKTTIALTAIANNQRKFGEEGIVIILSSEMRENKEYSENIGIVTEDVIVIKSKILENLFMELQDVLDFIYEIWETEHRDGKPKIQIVWDSVGATVARAEKEVFRENMDLLRKAKEKGATLEKIKHAKMAAFAGAATNIMKNMIAEIYDNEISFIAINHLKENFNTPGSYTPGGEWLDYLPCLALRPKLKEWVKVSEEDLGQITTVRVHKNDFGLRKPTEIEICLGYGLTLSESDIAFAVSAGIIKKESVRKHSFLKGKVTWSTKREFYDLYKSKNKFLNVLHTLVTKERHKVLFYEKGLDNE